jgi:hypothetical protein
MKLSIGQLREVIRKSLAGSQPEESYSIELMGDPAFSEKSVYVPDDIKKKIRKWAKDMKLSSR